MKKKQKRKSKRGVMTRIRYAPKSAPRPRRSVLRKVLGWVGGLILAAVLLGMLAAVVTQMFMPGVVTQEGEGDYAIVEIREIAAETAEGEESVAEARLRVEGREVAIPLTAEQLETVQPGTPVHVRYRITPRGRTRVLIVEEWELAGPLAAPPDGEEQE